MKKIVGAYEGISGDISNMYGLSEVSNIKGDISNF